MFDLSKINFIRTDKEHGRYNYSFVGLQKNTLDGSLEFWLPLGFDDFDITQFDTVKSFFFKMYRTFKIYVNSKSEVEIAPSLTSDRDGFIESERGFDFVKNNDSGPVFYGKLNALDKIIEGYDDMRIAALDKKEQKHNIIDYSRIHLYMHKAVYLEDDVIYLDEMNIPKVIITQQGPPILQLFSFIYYEIKKELLELDSVNERVFELAEQFKDIYLQPDSSLFSEKTFSETVDVLKQVLESIDELTIYKDEDYWHFFEAVEAFLYGERDENASGIYWGINNFYDLWEEMCQYYMLRQEETKKQLVFADVDSKLVSFGKLSLSPYNLYINSDPKKRELRPDLVLFMGFLESSENTLYTKSKRLVAGEEFYTIHWKNYDEAMVSMPRLKKIFRGYMAKNDKYSQNPDCKGIKSVDIDAFDAEVRGVLGSGTDLIIPRFYSLNNNDKECLIKIVDYKYMHQLDYDNYLPNRIDANGDNKIKDDIHKQLVYEWATQSNINKSNTLSEFWIPYYMDDMVMFQQTVCVENTHFNSSGIAVVKTNFKKLQEFYLQQKAV